MTYAQLEAHFRSLDALESALGVLQWDAATMLPDAGAERRGEQLALLQGMAHQRLTDPTLRDWLANSESENLDPWQTRNRDLMQWRITHATAVPESLVERMSLAGSRCEHRWRTAKKENDFQSLTPMLEEVISLVREYAAIKAEALRLSPYDALLDSYDPGRRLATVTPIFDRLKTELPPLIAEVEERQKGQGALPPLPPVPVPTQQAIGQQLMRMLGLSDKVSRLDVSAHPFCSGSKNDIRLTARYFEDEPLSGLMAVLHESGHGLYEQGLPDAWAGQPVGAAGGMAMHESQSLSIEMQLCRSRAFMETLARLLTDTTGQRWDAALLTRHVQRVERSFIRVEADEMTYPLHVILRTELETALLDGSLAVRDLPEAWNAKMQALLGITPSTDREGCLQDIHWMDGSLGYFPTYTLGAMTAAQWFHRLRSDLPGLDKSLANGDLTPATTWLHTHVHTHASRFDAEGLLQEITGQPLNPEIFLAHLRARYLES